MAFRPLALLRSSFPLKLLAALLFSVGLVLLLALVVVRRETERQVERVAERMTLRSREAFSELEQLQRLELERLATAFTSSRRTLAAVEAAAESSELDYLIQDVRYELDLKRMPQSLVAFTDQTGRPLLTLHDGELLHGADPAAAGFLARRLFESGLARVHSYREVDGELYAVQAQPLELAGRIIGTVALGVPFEDGVAQRLADVLGVELCFVVNEGCLAGTPLARAELGPLTASVPDPDALIRAADRRWRVFQEELSPDSPGEARRLIAVPMDEVLQPFERIRGALVMAGLLALAIAILLALTLSQELAGPVRELEAATARVAGGNYSTRVAVRSADEIGRLAAAFNTMTEGLELKERYRGVLDKVVSREVADELLSSDVMLGGETRDVTTLFVDISSFTSITEGMEPQRVVRLVNDVMSRLGAVVEMHGGVVDKYLGDGLMALFGAPVRRSDDAARALHAALLMQQAVAALVEDQVARGETPIRVAIGIHTGPVVAGNIGSANRLNYTAVGSSVNLAARLCQGAGPGTILVSEAVRQRTLDAFTFQALGARSFRGFSRPIEVYAVIGASDARGAENPHAGTDTEGVAPSLSKAAAVEHSEPPGAAVRPLLIALLLVGSAAVATPAQEPGLPTLSGLGLQYLSPSGRFQVDLSGRLDLEGYFPQEQPAWLVRATDPFLAGRLRLFTDVFLGDALYGLLEIRSDRGEAPDDAPVEVRVEQAFVRWTLPLLRRLQLQLGKFASPVGGYPARHHSPDDPLIRPPLPYDHHTVIDTRAVPAAAAGFLDWKDDPVRRPAGTPLIWGVPYPWGALLAGQFGRFDARAGITSAAPSGPPAMWKLDGDRLRHPSLVAAAGFAFRPELRVNAYYSQGPYLDEPALPVLPAGTDLDEFDQRMIGAEVIFQRGLTTLRAEAFVNRWDVPNITQDVRDVAYSVEGKIKLTPGLFAAARYGELRFNELSAASRTEDWDHDTRRFQLGGGYRLLRNSELRAEYLINRTSGDDPRDNLFSLQWWWAF